MRRNSLHGACARRFAPKTRVNAIAFGFPASADLQDFGG